MEQSTLQDDVSHMQDERLLRQKNSNDGSMHGIGVFQKGIFGYPDSRV